MKSLPSRSFRRSSLTCGVLLAIASAVGAADVGACLAADPPARIVRYAGADGAPTYGVVWQAEEGVPTLVRRLPATDEPRAALARGAEVWAQRETDDGPLEPLAPERICSPVEIPQSAIDAETVVMIAAGLNYAEHADEAGGGDVALFPKAVAPTAPYAPLVPPAGVVLLDWEVELAAYVLDEIDLARPPAGAAWLDHTAFLLANDVSDREPILRELSPFGPILSTGFVKAKSRPGFLPAGPWMVAGRALFDALATCGGAGLALELWVNEGAGPDLRQASSTDRMILDLPAILGHVVTQAEAHGVRPDMWIEREGRLRDYPLAKQGDGGLVVPAGSLVLTGTPSGVAMNVGAAVGAAFRGLVRLRSPIEQLRTEVMEADPATRGGYLTAGDVVTARIDGLGAQRFVVGEAGAATPADPCAPGP